MKEQDKSKIAIILTSENNFSLANEIKKNLTGSQIYTKADIEDTEYVSSIEDCLKDIYTKVNALIFIDSMGVCIRTIAPFIKGNNQDPAIVCADSLGKYVVSVISGYQGGASLLTKRVAHMLGAEAIITSQSDNVNLWALETLGERFGWTVDTNAASINYPQTSFINKKPTALLVDIVDRGTVFMERTVPQHVKIFYKYEDIDLMDFELLIAVTPCIYPEAGIQIIYYHPKVLHIGVSCRKYTDTVKIAEALALEIKGLNFSLTSIKSISSIDNKEDDSLLSELHHYFAGVPINKYTLHDLEDLQFLTMNDQSGDSITVASISEATALKSSNLGKLVVEKQKAIMSPPLNDFTFAIALDRGTLRQGHVAIVGAGPGDTDLISVRGRYILDAADLILFSESLVPFEFTISSKEGVMVKNTDAMTIAEQFSIIKEYYDKGKLIVCLYSGDPSIYGAIQDHLLFFDDQRMSYHITPGISSFLAAAAALESQLTIPNKVDSIILTRGDKEESSIDAHNLDLLAQSKSTICLYLSAKNVENIQNQLLKFYPPDTPVAVCYKLTWRDQRIYRCTLKKMSDIVKKHGLNTLTLIVVGEAIGNRIGLSRYLANDIDHLFTK